MGTSTLSIDAQGNIVVSGQTVTAGAPAVTMEGKTVSLGGASTEVVFGGTSTTQLGNIIASFIGGVGPKESTSSGTVTTSGVVQFTGAASLGCKASMTLMSVACLLTSMMMMVL